MGKRTVVLGASPKPERYSHKAVVLLKEMGFEVVPVHPLATEVAGLEVVPSLDAVEGAVHTVTVYLNAATSSKQIASILASGPARIILNPGAENPDLTEAAEAAGIEVLLACTLVLLRTGQY